MVKNQTGGNRTKSFARKNESSGNERLRLSECDEEVYACVTKLFGNTCAITTIEGENLIGHIRKKFSGKGKRTSTITDRCIVLVGMRHWEKTAKNCDILEVYSQNEVEQLKHIPKIRFERLLPLIMNQDLQIEKNDVFDFGISANNDYEEEKEELEGKGKIEFELKEEDEINIDDI
jgi:hypothetical protein